MALVAGSNCVAVLQVEVEAVRPDPASPAEELRLMVALLPVRVRADQRVCEFLAAFFAPQEDMVLVPAAPVPPPEASATLAPERPAAEDDRPDADGASRFEECTTLDAIQTRHAFVFVVVA